MRSTVVNPLGLVTQPNQHGQYPAGAMSVARNCCMRNPGIVQPLPAESAYDTDGPIASFDQVKRIYAASTSLLATHDTFLNGEFLSWITSGTRSECTFPTGYTFVTDSAEGCIRARERFVVLGDNGPAVLDSEGDTTARLIGMPRPSAFYSTGGTTTDGLAIPHNFDARYVSTISRTRSDGTEIEGAPSVTHICINTSGSTATRTLRVYWGAASATRYHLAAGDFVNLYRTACVATGTDPGMTFYLVKRHTLTSGEIAAGYVDILENVADAALGESPYFDGGSRDPRDNGIPGQCTDAVNFKGYTFYAQPNAQHQFKIRINGTVGNLASGAERTYGVGVRAITADSNSNTTLSNISAAHIKGLVIGQAVYGAAIPAGTTVTAVGATSITISQAATATAAVQPFSIVDRLKIGSSYTEIGYINTILQAAEDGEDVVVISDQASSTSNAGAVATNVDGAQFVIQRPWYHLGSFTINATNGQNYSPALPAIAATASNSTSDSRPNLVKVSKLDLPEAVPPESELLVGSGTIYRIVATTDALYAFCSDGLFRITGDADVWRVDPVDVSLRLYAKPCVDVMQEVVWAYTNRGLVRIAGMTVDEVSNTVIGDLIPGGAYTTSRSTFLSCDQRNREVWLTIRNGLSGDDGATTSYIYNTATNAFTSASDSQSPGGGETTAHVFAEYLDGLVWARVISGDSLMIVYRYTTGSTTRSNCEVQFQPITGDGQPFTEKQWQDVTLTFRNAHASATINVLVNGSAVASDISGTTVDGDRRYTAAVTRDGAISPRIRLGFQPEDQETSGWQLIGFSTRWAPLTEEVKR